MGVRKDCRHYSTRSTPDGDVVQRCRLGANTEMPFACPDDCLFFEPRSVSTTGWQRIERSEEGGLYGGELGPMDERLPPDDEPPPADS